MVELLICNQWVGGSSPSVGTIKKTANKAVFFYGMNNRGLEPERARGDRKSSVEIFVPSGESLLMSKRQRGERMLQTELRKSLSRFLLFERNVIHIGWRFFLWYE